MSGGAVLPARWVLRLLPALLLCLGLVACPGETGTSASGDRSEAASDDAPSGDATESTEVDDEDEAVPSGEGRPWFGASFRSPTDEEAEGPGGRSPVVRRVFAGSPADRAGVEVGDVVLAAGGERFARPVELRRYLRGASPGLEAVFSLLRDGEPVDAEVVFGSFDREALLDQILREGARWLAGAQRAGGGWSSVMLPDGPDVPDAPVSALALRALAGLPSGVRAEHREAIDAAASYLLEQLAPEGYLHQAGRIEEYRSYGTALLLESLCLLDPAAHADAIERMVAWFVESQLTAEEGMSEYDFRNGGWNYHDDVEMEVRADVSVAAYVVAALRAAGMATDSETLDRVERLLRRAQVRPDLSTIPAQHRGEAEAWRGGFAFTPREAKAGMIVLPDHDILFRPYGSTTADGLRTLLRVGVPPDDPRVEGAVDWFGRFFTARENPNFGEDPAVPFHRGIYFYYLASLSDALGLLGRTELETRSGPIDWARRIENALLRRQHQEGSWAGEEDVMSENDPVLATSFAVLALSRCRAAREAADPSPEDGNR